MTRLAIKVEDLSKEYVLGGEVDQQRTFREMLMGMVKEPIKRLQRLQGNSKQQERFWALKEINFSVNEGEVVGIIGANGAGKSTLLKLLSRITAPTTGQIQYRGKIASLLEVGTGFHPELSGRENIFINGAILGMTKSEITKRFDEIVDFSGVEKFLDTPVKRYSSGMYVRLAFAVAAHLDPDILIVDEVLAVGDVAFQKKCLGKMRDVSGQGRTVIFVSHNMMSIRQLCNKVFWLDKGQIKSIGRTSETIQSYLSRGILTNYSWKPNKDDADHRFYYEEVRLTALSNNTLPPELPADMPFRIEYHFHVLGKPMSGRIALRLTNMEGIVVLSSANTDGRGILKTNWDQGSYVEYCEFPGHLLAPGRYSLTISQPLSDSSDIIYENILNFSVSDEMSLKSLDGRDGIVSPMLKWGVFSS